MSPKSRPPKAGKPAKGKKGKKGAVEESTTIVVEEEASGPPFGLIVLFAIVLAMPPLMQFAEGTMPFDGAALRFLAALIVSWILTNLVYVVAMSFTRTETAETIETTTTSTGIPSFEGGYTPDPDSHYRTSPADAAAEPAP